MVGFNRGWRLTGEYVILAVVVLGFMCVAALLWALADRSMVIGSIVSLAVATVNMLGAWALLHNHWNGSPWFAKVALVILSAIMAGVGILGVGAFIFVIWCRSSHRTVEVQVRSGPTPGRQGRALNNE